MRKLYPYTLADDGAATCIAGEAPPLTNGERMALANDNATLMFPYPNFPAAGVNVTVETAGSVLTRVMLVPSSYNFV